MSASQRSFGLMDHGALWGSLGLTLYVMPFGSLLVPSLGLRDAFLAVVVASLLGALLVAAVAGLASRDGLSSAELFSLPFGPRARRPLAALLTLRNVAWAAFALALIADSAELVSQRALGAGLRPVWMVLFAVLGLALAAAGPHFTVQRVLRRAGLWVALVLAAGITVSAYLEFGVPAYLTRPAVGGWPSFWQAVDVALVVPLLWLPVAADFARLDRDVGRAFAGVMAGLFPLTAWMAFLGAVYLPAVGSEDIPGFVVGMQLGLGGLAVLFLLQTDEVFANLHAAEVAAEGVLSSPRRTALALSGAVAVALALGLDFTRMEGTLLLVASLFVPLAGVLLADRAAAKLAPGPAWPPALAAWALGFFLYHWIAPSEAAWWVDALRWGLRDLLGLPFPLTEEASWPGAAIPAFGVAFLFHGAARVAVHLLTTPVAGRPSAAEG